MLDKLGINPTYLIGQIINFGILLFVLTKFLYKPILKILDTRAQKIAQGLKAAEGNLAQKEKLETVKKEQLQAVKKEVEKIIAATREEAHLLKEQIISQAEVEAKKKTEKEYARLREQLNKEEALIRGRLGKITVDLTKKLLQKTLDAPIQEKIFKAQLKKLQKIV